MSFSYVSESLKYRTRLKPSPSLSPRKIGVGYVGNCNNQIKHLYKFLSGTKIEIVKRTPKRNQKNLNLNIDNKERRQTVVCFYRRKLNVLSNVVNFSWAHKEINTKRNIRTIIWGRIFPFITAN